MNSVHELECRCEAHQRFDECDAVISHIGFCGSESSVSAHRSSAVSIPAAALGSCCACNDGMRRTSSRSERRKQRSYPRPLTSFRAEACLKTTGT